MKQKMHGKSKSPPHTRWSGRVTEESKGLENSPVLGKMGVAGKKSMKELKHGQNKIRF